MEITELAEKIASSIAEMDHKKCGYYMTNISHPVIEKLKRRFCEERKINNYIPMSDPERIEFELWLFQPSIRKMVEDMFCGKEDNAKK